jgi:hypothetical protein
VKNPRYRSPDRSGRFHGRSWCWSSSAGALGSDEFYRWPG